MYRSHSPLTTKKADVSVTKMSVNSNKNELNPTDTRALYAHAPLDTSSKPRLASPTQFTPADRSTGAPGHHEVDSGGRTQRSQGSDHWFSLGSRGVSVWHMETPGNSSSLCFQRSQDHMCSLSFIRSAMQMKQAKLGHYMNASRFLSLNHLRSKHKHDMSNFLSILLQ